MNHEIAQRPDQHTGNSTPYSYIYKNGGGILQNSELTPIIHSYAAHSK